MSDVADTPDDEIVTGPAADAKAISKRETATKRRARIADEDLRAVMNTRQGRRFMWELLATTHVYQTSFRHGEAVESAVYREGERNIGLQLLDRLHRTCADLYAVMVRETVETDQ